MGIMANVVYLIIVRPSSAPFRSRARLTDLLHALSGQGANRPDGIGFFAVQALLKDANSHVIVLAREPDSAVELNELAKSNGGRLVVLKADVEDVDSIKVRPLLSRLFMPAMWCWF